MQKIAAKFPTVTELWIFQSYHYINLRKFMVTIYFIRDKSRFNKSWASFMGPQVGPKKFLKKLHTFEICWKNRIFFKSLKTPGGFSYRSNFDLPPSSVHMDGISHLMKKKVGIVTHNKLHQPSKFTTQVGCLIQEYSTQTLLHLADVMSSNTLSVLVCLGSIGTKGIAPMGHLSTTLSHQFCPLLDFDIDNCGTQNIYQTLVGCLKAMYTVSVTLVRSSSLHVS